MKRKRMLRLIIPVILVLAAMLPAVAGAEAPTRDTRSWTDGAITITFSTPETYLACNSMYDVLWTQGVPENWTLRGAVTVRFITPDGPVTVPGGDYPVDQPGDLNLTVYYPPVDEWPITVPEWNLRELHVNVAIRVYDENGNYVPWVGDDPGSPGWLGPWGQDWDVYCYKPPEEGCTPGYWKNHLDAWDATGYNPSDDFDTTFGVDLFDPDITLDDAIRAKGGKENRIARHGTAALLSAAQPDVDYPDTEAGVIALVQAGDADTLEMYNELGCPLD